MNLRTRLLVIGGLLVAWGARVWALGDVPFWYDEGLVGWSARLSFIDTARWTSADVHPALYFWAVTVWRLLVGESEFALRLLSVAFGLLSVVAVYKIGERINGSTLGALAALLIGVARFHIWWSQELRMYILGSMFMLFSIWLTLRILHGRPKRADWVALVLVGAAGLWSLYLVAFALAFESLYASVLLGIGAWKNLSHAKTQRRKEKQSDIGVIDVQARVEDNPMTWRKYVQWVGSQVAIALIFLPWFLYFLTQFRTWSDSTPFDFKLFVQFYATMLAVGVPANIDQWLAPMLLMWAVLGVGALVGLRGRHGETMRRGGWLVVLLLVLPPLTVYMGTTPRSFFYSPRVEPRYLFPFIWSFYLVLAWCVWRLARAQRWLGIAAALLVIGLSGYADANYYAGRVPNDVYQSLTAMLRAERLPGDGVVLDDDRNWPIFEYYFASGVKDWTGVPNGSRIKASDAEFILGKAWQAHDGLWLVWNEDALRIDENHVLEQWLNGQSVYKQETVFGTKRLIFYARTAERAQRAGALAANVKPTYTLNTTVAEGVTLKGYDQATLRYRVGDEILIGTYWQNAKATNVTAILQDARGTERGKQMLTIPAGESRQIVRYSVTTDLDPAAYRIVVAAGAQTVALAQVRIDEPDVAAVSQDLAIQTPMDVRFQNGIRLMGYDASAETLHPGDNLGLTLYWQTGEPVAQRYKAFVHILGPTFNPKTKNPVWGQQDQEPLNGVLPTTSWGLNRLIADPYLVKLSPDAPPGKYTVEIGWYHPVSGERLTVAGSGADHVNLFEVDVR